MNEPRPGSYKCIIVDPPWDQGKTGKRSVGTNQGIDLDYPTMTSDEIAALPVGEWAAEESFLWLWATNSRSGSSGKPILVQAFELMEHWGFRYYTALTWARQPGHATSAPTGSRQNTACLATGADVSFRRNLWAR